MPLFMDVHRNIPGLTQDALAKAHIKDVEVQTKYGVHYHKYWFNEEAGTVFCLVEGPDKDTCIRVHAESHGLIADDVIEVEPRLIDVFMGTAVENAAGAVVLEDGSLDAAFRVVLFTEVANYPEVAQRLGDTAALQMLELHHRIVCDALPRHNGQEVRLTGEGLLTCFRSASSALRFAMEVQDYAQTECEPVGGVRPQLRMGIAAGEPVARHQDLFGLSVAAARRICERANGGEVLVAAAVRELAVGKGFTFTQRGTEQLKGFDEPTGIFALQLPSYGAATDAVAETPYGRKLRLVGQVRDFWLELKRRHVVTVGAVYAGVLFVVLQVAELTFEALYLPEWAFQLLLLIGIFGFPLAIVLAWMFDLKEEPRRERQ